MSKSRIGVFDSGMGGLSVAQAIQRTLPENEVLFVQDEENVPYGSKSLDELIALVIPIFQSMVDEGCDVIVIACNTVTTTLIQTLRDFFSIPLVGIEPMIKPAASLTKSNCIAVCATPVTLRSERYTELKRLYANDMSVIEPDCSEWASMIEHDQIDDQKVGNIVDEVIAEGADVIILACTHYHWIDTKIENLAAGRARIIQPEQAIITQLKRVLASLER